MTPVKDTAVQRGPGEAWHEELLQGCQSTRQNAFGSPEMSGFPPHVSGKAQPAIPAAEPQAVPMPTATASLGAVGRQAPAVPGK